MSAAQAATPRISPIARKASSLPVTPWPTPSDRAPHRARAVRSVAADRSERQLSGGRRGDRRWGARGSARRSSRFAALTRPMVDSDRRRPPIITSRPTTSRKGTPRLAIDPAQEFLVQPVDASWLQCNIECQEACPVGTNCRGYLNLAAEGRFEEGYILSREPNPVAAMCSYVCSAPCERACRRGDIDRPLAIRAMKRFLVEWHEASGIPDVMPDITPREERVADRGRRPGGSRRRARARSEGLSVHGLRQPSVWRRDHAHRRPRLPAAA